MFPLSLLSYSQSRFLENGVRKGSSFYLIFSKMVHFAKCSLYGQVQLCGPLWNGAFAETHESSLTHDEQEPIGSSDLFSLVGTSENQVPRGPMLLKFKYHALPSKPHSEGSDSFSHSHAHTHTDTHTHTLARTHTQAVLVECYDWHGIPIPRFHECQKEGE